MGLLANPRLDVGSLGSTIDELRSARKISVVSQMGDIQAHRQLFDVLTNVVIDHSDSVERARLPRGSRVCGGIGGELQVDFVVNEVTEVHDKGEENEHESKDQCEQDRDLSVLSIEPELFLFPPPTINEPYYYIIHRVTDSWYPGASDWLIGRKKEKF